MANENRRKKSLAELLRATERALLKITARFDDDVEAVARVAKVLDEIVTERLPAEPVQTVPTVRRSSAEEHVLREAARAGAFALVITGNTDGSAQVCINGGPPFRVQAKLAALLRILATPGGRAADDGLLGWRSYDEVAAALTKHTGRATTRRNVVQTIHKLRKAFREQRQNWLFIQTDHRGCVRFALRAGTLDAPAEAPSARAGAGAGAGIDSLHAR